MATGRERRAERLNERLRGAQRTNIDDDSFSLDIGGLALPAAPQPVEDAIPSSSSSKRRRSNENEESRVNGEPPSSRRRSTRPATKDPYDLPDSSKNSVPQPSSDPPPVIIEPVAEPVVSSSARTTRSRRSNPSPILNDDALETLPAPGSLSSPAQRRISQNTAEEVEESPANAPGSGRRRRVQSYEATQSSTRLHDALRTDDTAPLSSSPLARKSRVSDAALSVRSRRSLRGSTGRQSTSFNADDDELSPNRPPAEKTTVGSDAEALEPDVTTSPVQPVNERQAEAADQPEGSEEEAEEIGAEEAAQAIGNRRLRRSPRTKSPELGSSMIQPEREGSEDDNGRSKRRRRQQPQSPAIQKRPVTKTKKPPKPATKSSTKPNDGPKDKPKDKSRDKPREKSKDKPNAPSKKPSKSREQGEDDDNALIEITVQKFMNNTKPGNAEDEAGVEAEIPFANRSGGSVVDVFAQVCEEVTTTAMSHFEELANNATDTAQKKECRVKFRAVKAYKQELSSRLLEHTLQLNHWHSLRKRVRHVQKEKLALRDEILRLKAEREQVALQMDEIRIKHENDTKEAKYRLDTSALMQDIDLAVAQGQEAPQLSRAEKKQAELANLELVISRVVDEASSASSTGGLLRQVKDFNAFLERAALALEAK